MRTTMKPLLVAALVGVVVGAIQIVVLAQSTALGSVISRFTGTWKEDVSKRKVGSTAHLRFQVNAKGSLEEVRGPETRPIVQPVMFDGKSHEFGDSQGNNISWKRGGANTFERLLADRSGRPVTTRRISISTDGKTLTEETESKRTDGQTSVNTIVYQRVSGEGAALTGRWKPVSFKTNNPSVQKFEAAGPSALKVSSDNGNTWTVTLDGKPAPVTGPAVIDNTMTAAKRIDDRTIEFTESREGVTSGRTVRTVSADGKTLTATSTTVGPNSNSEPSVIVYIKQ
jgi:hypothetical protein